MVHTRTWSSNRRQTFPSLSPFPSVPLVCPAFPPGWTPCCPLPAWTLAEALGGRCFEPLFAFLVSDSVFFDPAGPLLASLPRPRCSCAILARRRTSFESCTEEGLWQQKRMWCYRETDKHDEPEYTDCPCRGATQHSAPMPSTSKVERDCTTSPSNSAL